MKPTDLYIEVDMDALHDWWGPSVMRWACCARAGEFHVCMRGARVDGSDHPGPHRCACGEKWSV